MPFKINHQIALGVSMTLPSLRNCLRYVFREGAVGSLGVPRFVRSIPVFNPEP